MAINNNAELGFEKKIWDAACILRGNMDAAEYKHVILGLIFLKYISDRFEYRYDFNAKRIASLSRDQTEDHVEPKL